MEPMEPERVPKKPPEKSGFGVEKTGFLRIKWQKNIPHQIQQIA